MFACALCALVCLAPFRQVLDRLQGYQSGCGTFFRRSVSRRSRWSRVTFRANAWRAPFSCTRNSSTPIHPPGRCQANIWGAQHCGAWLNGHTCRPSTSTLASKHTPSSCTRFASSQGLRSSMTCMHPSCTLLFVQHGSCRTESLSATLTEGGRLPFTPAGPAGPGGPMRPREPETTSSGQKHHKCV